MALSHESQWGAGIEPPSFYVRTELALHSSTNQEVAVCGVHLGRTGNPYLFVVGCPRSGTTLLQRMLNAHARIAITPETHWIPRIYRKRTGLTVDGFVTPEMISHLLELPKFTRLGIGTDLLLKITGNGQLVSYSSFVTSVFDLYGMAQGKALVGDKTPGYVKSIGILHALWRNAKFVHIIRDGRDVCLSVAKWRKTAYKQPGTFSTWAEDSVTTTAFWWEAMVRLGRNAGQSLGPEAYCEIRYESLVESPAKECAALCAFLGVPFDDAMLRFHEGRTKSDPNLDAKHAWLPVMRGLRDWRTQMPTASVERFEAAAGALLGELGYERAFSRLGREKLETARRLRKSLSQDPDWIHASDSQAVNTSGRPTAEEIEP